MKSRSLSFLRFFFGILGLSVLLCSSCEKKTQVITCQFWYDVPDVKISYLPSDTTVSEVTLYQWKLQIPLDSILNEMSVPNGEVESAIFTKLTLTQTDPGDSAFNWLSYARVVSCSDSLYVTKKVLTSNCLIDQTSKKLDFLPYNSISIITPFNIKSNTCYLKILANPKGHFSKDTVKMYLSPEVHLVIRPLPE